MKRIVIVMFLFNLLFIQAKSQIAMVYAKDNNNSVGKYMIDCSHETSSKCMSYLRNIMENSGEKKVSSFCGSEELSKKSGVYVVISSTWRNYKDIQITGYGFGVGNSCSEAEENAIKRLKTYWDWKKSYGYNQVECKRYTNTFVKD